MVGTGLDDSIDNLLLRAGVRREHIALARVRSAEDGELAKHLEQIAGLSESRFAALVAERLGLAFSPEIDDREVEPELLVRVQVQFCRKNRLLPLKLANGRVKVATADPLRYAPLDDLRVVYGREIEAVVVPPSVLKDAVTRAFDRASSTASSIIEGIESDRALDLHAAEREVPDLVESEDEAPIIRLVNSIIFQAAKDGASDIHIEPFERHTSVRYRVDGMLVEVLTPPRRIHAALASRIKVMASLNIAEKRLPQDGGIRTRVAGRDLDVRASTVPTAHGERVVMRLLDRSSTLLGLEELGFSGRNLAALRRLAQQSHGIVLVTGPTGSGKTTTLYAALAEINSVEKNILTIEDPVEYQLPGVGQMQVNPRIELTFAAGLRSILRQDPDVIMVGEIRDSETARIAIQAALTGHLVLSTLHTNDSFSAVTRLLDMGIEPFLVSSSVIGILAQRLVRKLCRACSRPVAPAESGLGELGLGYLTADSPDLRVTGPGCDACRQTGYRGRTAISELLAIDDVVRSHVMQRADAATLRDVCTTRGMTTIRDDGADKVRHGVTSTAEVLRVTAVDAE
jgi:general secretion pathway protein E